MKIFGLLATLLALGCAHAHAMVDSIDDETSHSAGDLLRTDSQRSLSKENRIYGGSQAPHGKYPYFVAGWACGGVLVWKDIVLTAAHCHGIFRKGAIVGAYSAIDDTDGSEFIPTDGEYVHPDFRHRTLENDYMIVKLSRSSSLPPAKLNKDPSHPPPGTPLVTMGFGETEDSSNPDFLLETSVVAEDDPVCLKLYRSDLFFADNMMCTQVDNVHDACYGDSGSPLVDKKDVVVGLVSWGKGCAHETKPNVYSRVSHAYCWTWSMICRLSQSPPRKKCQALKQTCSTKKKKSFRGKRNRPPKDFGAKHRSLWSGPCVDTNQLFDLEGEVQDKDCEWLSSNRWWQGEDLCAYPHIAHRCPSTCGACHLDMMAV